MAHMDEPPVPDADGGPIADSTCRGAAPPCVVLVDAEHVAAEDQHDHRESTAGVQCEPPSSTDEDQDRAEGAGSGTVFRAAEHA